MTHLAPRLRRYLNGLQVHYDVSVHARTSTTGETAQVAHVPGDVLAKAVLLKDEKGPLLAVLRSTHHVSVDLLNKALGRHLELVPEAELDAWFDDCTVGALPVAGAAYGIDVVVDTSMEGAEEVYFEAGDHRHLVHVDAEGFAKLMETARRANFSVHN
jgi:Ala-tRNA(Pro) deacylase